MFKSEFESFKPYYKWNTFNTKQTILVIGIGLSFKPCYKWNTFNTVEVEFGYDREDTF